MGNQLRDTRRLVIGTMPRTLFYLLTLCTCLSQVACNPLVNSFAFHPDDTYVVPTDALPAETREVYFDTEDGVHIQALHLRNPSSETITIFFHGNAGNIFHRLADFQRLRKLGTSVLAVSYRGYAKSEGSPSEAGIYSDAKAAFKYVTGPLGYPPSRIFVLGRSIGSTAAADLAQDKAIAGLILVSPLSSAKEQAEAMGLGFATSLVGNAFDNMGKMSRLKAPLLVIHGTRDEVIPIAMGRTVHAVAPGEKFFHPINGAGHNDLSGKFAREYWGIILAFFEYISKNRTG